MNANYPTGASTSSQDPSPSPQHTQDIKCSLIWNPECQRVSRSHLQRAVKTHTGKD